MANKSIISNSKLDAIAAAIAAKDGGTGAMTADQMATRIAAIPAGDIDGLLDGDPSFTELVTGAARIPASLFSGNQYVRRVEMTTARQILIDSAAFYSATALEEFSAPNAVAITLVSQAFNGARPLTELRGNFFNLQYSALSSSSIKRFISTYTGPMSCSTGYAAFGYSNALELVDLAGVWTFGGSTFTTSPNLKTIVLRGTDGLSKLGGASDLNGAHADLAIYVPDSKLAEYCSATNWANYASKIHPLSEYVEPSI